MTLPSVVSNGITISVVGDVMLDVYIHGKVNRISPEAPVPILLERVRAKMLGGAGNVASNIIGLGCMVKLFGVVGEDRSGMDILSIINSEDRMNGRIVMDVTRRTTTKTRAMAGSQHILRIDDERWGENCSAELNVDEVLEGTNAVIISDYNKGFLNDDVLQMLINEAKKKGVKSFVDTKRHCWDGVRGCDVIKPNVRELERAMLKTAPNHESVAKLALEAKEKYKLGAIIVTMGPDGMMIITDDGVECGKYLHTKAKTVFDVTGAGDTVLAVVAACMCSGYSIIDAADIANIAAGMVIGESGTVPINGAKLWKEVHSKEI